MGQLQGDELRVGWLTRGNNPVAAKLRLSETVLYLLLDELAGGGRVLHPLRLPLGKGGRRSVGVDLPTLTARDPRKPPRMIRACSRRHTFRRRYAYSRRHALGKAKTHRPPQECKLDGTHTLGAQVQTDQRVLAAGGTPFRAGELRPYRPPIGNGGRPPRPSLVKGGIVGVRFPD